MKQVLTDWLIKPDGIAERLSALRSRSGLTGKELADKASWPVSKISKLENGRQVPTVQDLQQWALVCESSDDLPGLLELFDQIQSIHLDFKRRAAQGMAPIQTAIVELVEESTLIQNFETTFVPGILQIPEYTRSILENLYELNTGDQGIVRDTDAALSERMRRQQHLYGTGKQFEFIIAESVLRWLIVPPDVMQAQLDRLLVAMSMPQVKLGVLPFGVQLTMAPQNKFDIYDGAAVVETFVGETLHNQKDSQTYSSVMHELWKEAVTGKKARQLILNAATSLNPITNDSEK